MGSSWIRDQTWQADASSLSYQGSPRPFFYSLTWIPSMLKLEVISMQVHWSLYILQTRRQRCCLMISFILGSILNWLSNQNLLDQSNHCHSCSISVTFKYPFSQPSHCPSHPAPPPPPRRHYLFPGAKRMDADGCQGRKWGNYLWCQCLAQWFNDTFTENSIDTLNIRLLWLEVPK